MTSRCKIFFAGWTPLPTSLFQSWHVLRAPICFKLLSKPLIQQEEKCSSQNPYTTSVKNPTEKEGGTDRSSAPQLTATSSSCRESRLPNGSFSGLPVASVVPACDSLLTLFLQARKTVGGWFGCLSLISENQQQCGTGHYRGWKRKSTNVLWLWKDGIFRIHCWGISLLVLETYNYFQNKAVRCPSNLFCRVSNGLMQTHFSWADGSSCYCLLWQVHSKTPGGNVTLISLRTKSVIRI